MSVTCDAGGYVFSNDGVVNLIFKDNSPKSTTFELAVGNAYLIPTDRHIETIADLEAWGAEEYQEITTVCEADCGCRIEFYTTKSDDRFMTACDKHKAEGAEPEPERKPLTREEAWKLLGRGGEIINGESVVLRVDHYGIIESKLEADDVDAFKPHRHCVGTIAGWYAYKTAGGHVPFTSEDDA